MARISRTKRFQRGVTLIDALVGLSIGVVAIVGMLNLVTFLMNVSEDHTQQSVATGIGRTIIEEVRNQGFPNYPEGSQVRYYNVNGQVPTTGPVAASRYKVTWSVISDKLATTFTGIKPANTALRTVKVEVLSYPRQESLLKWGTTLCRGGV